MIEGRPTAPEFQLGDKVPILEHTCIVGIKARLGLYGIINELSPSGQPLFAKCNDCSKIITVDFKTLATFKRKIRTSP